MSDALDSLRTALAPKRGLKPIPLADGSYQLTSPPASAERLLNMYPEKLPAGGRSAFILKPTPGLQTFAIFGEGPVLAMASVGGTTFAISGDRAWRLLDDLSPPLDLGPVGVCAGEEAHSIAVGPTGIVFCVPPRAYITGYSGEPVEEITTGSGNFPEAGASSVAYLNGYYIFSSFRGDYIFLSKLLDPGSFDSLDYVYMTSVVDLIERCISHNGELWLFCNHSVQVWYDTGNADAPFRPRTGAIIPHGLGAPRSVVSLDESLWWVGIDNACYRTQGYRAERVSNHALEALLADYGADGAEGFLRTITSCGYQFEGHPWVSYRLPDSGAFGRTFVYDAATKQMHERCSTSWGLGAWNVITAVQMNARVLLGSVVNGAVYHTNVDYWTEDGVNVPREVTLPALVTHGPLAHMHRLEVEMEVGTGRSPASVELNWSNDGGITWTTPRVLSAGALGATRTRVAANRLGTFRQRVIHLRSTTPMTIYGVDVDVPTPNPRS